MMKSRSYLLQICVNSVESAKAAVQQGADLIQLGARLDLDGLNPSLETINQVCAVVDIPVHVIIRPRAGNFVYSEQEILLMIKSIKKAKDLGVAGIVSGALMEDGKLDVKSTARLIRASHPLSFTFSQAFDRSWDPLYVFDLLDRLGVDYLMSSGHEANASLGIPFLEELSAMKNQVKIMAAGEVNYLNVSALWAAGIRRFHINGMKHLPDGSSTFDHEKAYLTIDRLDALDS